MATEEKLRRDLAGGELMSFPKPSSESSSVLGTSPASGRKVIVKSADMKESMQKEAIDCAIAAFEKNGVEKDIAEQIKKEFDKNYGPTWHCIVGRNFDEQNVTIEMHAIAFAEESGLRLISLGSEGSAVCASNIGAFCCFFCCPRSIQASRFESGSRLQFPIPCVKSVLDCCGSACC